jgi:hypothetical protein
MQHAPQPATFDSTPLLTYFLLALIEQGSLSGSVFKGILEEGSTAEHESLLSLNAW